MNEIQQHRIDAATDIIREVMKELEVELKAAGFAIAGDGSISFHIHDSGMSISGIAERSMDSIHTYWPNKGRTLMDVFNEKLADRGNVFATLGFDGYGSYTPPTLHQSWCAAVKSDRAECNCPQHGEYAARRGARMMMPKGTLT